MPFICYERKRFSASSMAIIDRANGILENFRAQGYDVTLRQLYYQFVAADLIPNRQSEYKRLGGIINDARMAGLIDWDSIEDRTRNIRTNGHWSSPKDFLTSVAGQYGEDVWADQDYYVEVWIEKDALVGVMQSVCPGLDVPYFSCRGYTSQSEMWSAAMRINRACRFIPDTGGLTKTKPQRSRRAIVIHLGDHDPSGVDMTRDVEDRLNKFSASGFKSAPKWDPTFNPVDIQVRRIALTMDQVEEHKAPPNPAKITDSRAAGYIKKFGEESWELDALSPATLAGLIRSTVAEYVDVTQWEKTVSRIKKNRAVLENAAKAMK